MPTTTNPMRELYARLSRAGLPRTYVKKALPDWWQDEIADSPAGYQHGLLILAQHLGLDIGTLLDPGAEVRFRPTGECKYKRTTRVPEHRLMMCRDLATRVAELAATATTVPYRLLPAAVQVRQTILSNGARWVGLSELLNYCWDMGVPVLHLDVFPKKSCRPDGFATSVNGRPVIVLCKRSTQCAWLLFILAHEIGHVALGHLPEGGSIIDEKVHENVSDEEEEAANTFAIELLTGSPRRRYHTPTRWPSAASLAKWAVEHGAQDQVDPGHVVLNYAYTMGRDFMPIAQAALKHLHPSANAVRLVRQVMADRLDWQELPADTSEFLMRVAKDEAKR